MIWGVCLIIAGLVGVYFLGQRSGTNGAKKDQAEQTIKTIVDSSRPADDAERDSVQREFDRAKGPL